MARGRGRKHQHGGRNKRKRHDVDTKSLSKKQKTHLKQFGEVHPADERESNERYRRIADTDDLHEGAVESSSESSEEEEEPSAFQQLVSTINPRALQAEISESSSEDEIEDQQDKYDETEVKDDENDDSDSGDDGKDDREDADDGKDDADDYRDQTDDEDGEKEGGEEEEVLGKENDPFTLHFEKEFDDDVKEKLNSCKTWERHEIKLPHLGQCKLMHLSCSDKTVPSSKHKDLRKLHVKQKLCEETSLTNLKFANVSLSQNECFTAFQRSLFSVINNYQDVLYCDRSVANGEEIRLLYCVHALNHVLKTRSRVIAHNAKIKSKKDDIADDHRDQGLTRPKVLIVVPFRESALRTVNMFMSLLTGENDKTNVMNKKRFLQEYSLQLEDSKKGKKPEDYEQTFAGNIDDHFRLGISVSKKSLKLYTEFYGSDIIIASPLGLRTLIGGEGDSDRDYDFLSSIELMVMDQMDVCLMQNWDHILHVMSHLHLQPQKSHGVDFSRVRMWTLDGLSKFYRQTLLFSGLACPEVNAIFSKHCYNWAGKILVPKSPTPGTICQVVTQLPQVFQRIEVPSFSQVPEDRFEYFKTKVLPQYKDKLMSHTLIFVSSYFDFVRLRNYMKKEEMSSVHICEYSKNEYMNRNRSAFFHGLKQFMLYTERIHFYRRYHLKGIKHLIFYDLPMHPQFYSELCNMLVDPTSTTNFTCTVLYTKYDAQRLAAIVGTDRAGQMIGAEKNVHMFVTGEES